MANQNATTERTILQTKRCSKGEAAALRKNHVVRHQRCVSSIHLVFSIVESLERLFERRHERFLILVKRFSNPISLKVDFLGAGECHTEHVNEHFDALGERPETIRDLSLIHI